MNGSPKYDRFPVVQVSDLDSDCSVGWDQIAMQLEAARVGGAGPCVVECYPGVDVEAVCDALTKRLTGVVLRSEIALLTPEELAQKFDLGSDRVFAEISRSELEDFFDMPKLQEMRSAAANHSADLVIVGTGASLIAPEAGVLVYADLARWEIQRRQRAHEAGNLGMHNKGATAAELYKRAFFLDWRVADRLKAQLLAKVDFLLDTNVDDAPKMISGDSLRGALKKTAERPFRVVPFFDPGPWGGHWMKEKFDLPENGSNYAWAFDCVPEENSLLLGFGDIRVEVPAMDLVLFQPRELLGDAVYRAFGAEFPIRFDYLDTVGGGNLSLQVHPLRAYIREKFGMDYTQDESYYMFEAEPDATVYLGLRDGVDRREFEADLRTAQEVDGEAFPAEKYVNVWPAKKHDHFLIPAGTIHCSGRNSVVLEISATPYIFTFKLWDWGRLGLDGRPRPVHLDHGLANLQWERTTEWVKSNLINRTVETGRQKDWVEESTGLHELEFIETRRHWFTGVTPHHTFGTVNVLNLVEGDEAVVESPHGAFDPFPVRYGETFIVPAAVGAYNIRPARSGMKCATMKAFVRSNYVF